MTKQFTIPCQFGGQTSPVTFYIGHPDSAHHPIKFQSDWLSSSKGGTVPQDLMMTLQKLHDLALENNADFEELCYYSLVSATNNSSDGVSPDEITNYADEYVKKELAGEDISVGISDNTSTKKNTSVENNNDNKTNVISDDNNSTTVTHKKITSSNTENLTKNNDSADNMQDGLLDEDLLLDEELIEDNIALQNNNNNTNSNDKIINDFDDDLLLEDGDENLEKSNIVKVVNNENNSDIDNSIDEDLLLDDDMMVEDAISK